MHDHWNYSRIGDIVGGGGDPVIVSSKKKKVCCEKKKIKLFSSSCFILIPMILECLLNVHWTSYGCPMDVLCSLVYNRQLDVAWLEQQLY